MGPLSGMAKNTTELVRNQLSELHLGIVCPMANEETTAVRFVEAVLAECAPYCFKTVTFFAVLDGKSNDNTRQFLNSLKERRPCLRVVWAPESKGVVQAYVRGYREALDAGSDWILEIDSGFSHQPSEIPQFFEKMMEGYDCVFGSRFCEGGSIAENSSIRYFISRGGTVLSNLLLGTTLKDMTSGFELFTRDSLRYVMDRGIQSRSPFFQTEIRTYCHHLKIVEVPIHYRAGSHEIKGAALRDSFRNLWRLFRQRLKGQL